VASGADYVATFTVEQPFCPSAFFRLALSVQAEKIQLFLTRRLETLTSPFLSGRKLCMTHSDGGRRDNNPPTAGEGSKVNRMNEQLIIPGFPLPV
jgi:hypothetical protein